MNDRYGETHCWEERSEAVSSFILDSGEVFGCPFFHLVRAQYSPGGQLLLLEWSSGVVAITGPKTLEFYKEFARQHATWIKADGKDIQSVTLIRPTTAVPPLNRKSNRGV